MLIDNHMQIISTATAVHNFVIMAVCEVISAWRASQSQVLCSHNNNIQHQAHIDIGITYYKYIAYTMHMHHITCNP